MSVIADFSLDRTHYTEVLDYPLCETVVVFVTKKLGAFSDVCE